MLNLKYKTNFNKNLKFLIEFRSLPVALDDFGGNRPVAFFNPVNGLLRAVDNGLADALDETNLLLDSILNLDDFFLFRS